MELLLEVDDGMYHDLTAPKIGALREYGPVLCTSGPPGTTAADYAAEAAKLGASALFMGSEAADVSANDLLPLATSLRALSVGSRLLYPEALAGFEVLGELRVARWHYGAVAALGEIKSLRWLSLSEAGKLTDLEDLPRHLEFLEITYPSKLTDLRPLTKLQDLEAIVLGPANRLEDLTPLSSMPTLRYLSLEGTLLRDPSPLREHPGIEVLIWGGKRVADMPAIAASMPVLRSLHAPTTAAEDRSWRPQDLDALHKFQVIRS